MLRKLIAAGLIVGVCVTAATVAYASTNHNDFDQVRRATSKYRDLPVAEAAQYGRLLDAAGIACIDMPGMGAMGVHYVNGSLVGDTTLDPLAPEALVYEPDEHGQLHLVALEYITFQSAWDAVHSSPPSLFGQPFDLTPLGNRFGLPAFYSLHAWVWKHNSAGTFAMWNPNVTCNPAREGDDDHAAHEHGGSSPTDGGIVTKPSGADAGGRVRVS